MSKLMLTIAVGLLSVLNSGCAVSLHPVHSKDVLVSKPSLAGEWLSMDRNGLKSTGHAYEFTEGKHPGEYDVFVSHPEKHEHGIWEARLIQLGKHLYMDVLAADFETKPESLKNFLLPMHCTFRVRVQDNRITLIYLQMENLKALAEKENLPLLKRDANPDQFVLLSETKRLQEFIAKHGDKLVTAPQPMLILERRPPKAKKKQSARRSTSSETESH